MCVFDVSQTQGKDLPELDGRVSGDVGAYRERLIDFTIAQGHRDRVPGKQGPGVGDELRRQDRFVAGAGERGGVLI